jgi:PKD repeat protein
MAKRSAVRWGSFIILLLFLLTGFSLADNSPNVSNNVTKPDYIENQVVIQFIPEIAANQTALENISRSLLMGIDGEILEDLSAYGMPGIQLIKLNSNISVEDAITYYQKSPYIKYAEPNYIINTLPEPNNPELNYIYTIEQAQFISAFPNDPYFSQQWGLTKISAPNAWTLITNSNEVSVAVLDTGIDYTHPDLASHVDMNNGWNVINDNSDFMDHIGHGTHCSGIIGAVINNNMGIAGIIPHVKIVPIKWVNDQGIGNTFDEIKAIGRINQKNISIASISVGGLVYNQMEKDAIDSSTALFICCAGNLARNNDQYPVYPASYTSENIISVAASDQNDNLCSFSDYGRNSVDVAAPGQNIWSTVPGNHYEAWDGTSMATPIVSGLAGLIKSVRPGYSNVQIKNAILNGVDKKSALNGKMVTGGRVNATKTILALPKPPVVNFTANITTGNVPLTIAFYDRSSGPPNSWLWNFGDRNSSGLQNPVHTYYTAGNYSVSLISSNADGSGSKTQNNYIHLLPPKPVADFTANATSGLIPMTVRFEDKSLYNPYQWTWSFGDNQTSGEKNPTHVFTERGFYNISLSVAGPGGNDSSEKLEYIKAYSEVIIIPGMTKPPTDPDHDRIYEDLNGNGRMDFNDVITYFQNLFWIAQNEPVGAFDLNGNNRIDLNDLIRLFKKVGNFPELG